MRRPVLFGHSPCSQEMLDLSVAFVPYGASAVFDRAQAVAGAVVRGDEAQPGTEIVFLGEGGGQL